MTTVVACGPLVTIQDAGRPGHLARGLARGGAADRRALDEAAALLGDCGAGIEIPGAPLTLRLSAPAMVALTGAPMRAEAGGRALDWHAAHPIPAEADVTLRPTGQGVYSYLHMRGGFDTEVVMGSRAAHLIAGIGQPLASGDRLAHAPSDGDARVIAVADRFDGGVLRVLPTPQTALFPEAEIARFEATTFRRDTRGNRQGVRLTLDGDGFATEGQLDLLSDFILPGDVQMTGDGVPYILGPECQTTGGYPRIGTVIEADLPRAMQAPPGAALRFRFVTLDEARAARPRLPEVAPLVRHAGTAELLRANLIGGVISAKGETE
ncbi:KipI antagonist [Jannaschia seosinensis]|uniref:KipI antagonist n=1 Tax=Jannaschia seosinensis TaxID=313367 RepID=A0A0M7BCX1_9RHOB|nr:biotin-dependent carboxyltransferase family protein [Jannaschia seosinensis]CUH39662.1 KipI antagonist [Jannaschia seosinensis]